MALVEDLDNIGDLLFSAWTDFALRSQQYIVAIHFTISSESLLGHWCRWSFKARNTGAFSIEENFS
jgi:hypothetical protein